MEAVILTQLSIPEIRELFRQELGTFFENKPLSVSQTESDKLLTIQEAAELLKLSKPTIYGLVSKDQIPVSKRTKRLYFSKQELTQWIKEGRRKTVAEVQAETSKYLSGKSQRKDHGKQL